MTELVICQKKIKNSNNNNEIDFVELMTQHKYDFGSHLEFLKIPQMKIGKKTVIEWFSINNFSYWWIISPVVNTIFNENAVFVDNLISYIQKNSISKIYLKTGFEKIHLIKKICNIHNIELKIPKNSFLKFKIENSIKKNILPFYYYWVSRKKQKKRFSIHKKLKNTFTPSNNLTIITSHSLYRRFNLDIEIEKIKKEEFFIYPFLKILKEKKMPYVCIDLDYTLKGNYDVLSERLNEDSHWLPVEFFLTKKKSRKTKNTIKNLKNNIEKMKSFLNDQNITYHNIPLFDYLEDFFPLIFYEPHFPNYIHLINELEIFFQKYSPQKLIQVYEHGSFAKCFEIASKSQNFKSIGIQHGLFSEKVHDYMFKEKRTNDFPYGNPLPDVTCVYGNHFKEILINKGCYCSEQIIPIGNPTFYDLSKKKSILESMKIKENHFPKNKKIILIPLMNSKLEASNLNHDFLLLEKLWRNFKDENVLILVRKHPSLNLNQETLNFLFPNNKFLISKFSLIEDLYTSDVVLTTMSTVGIEAAFFQKPIIFVNMTNSESYLGDFQKYMIENNIAFLAREKNLLEKLSFALNIQKTSQFYINNEEFLKQFFNFGEKTNFEKLLS